MSDYGTIIEPGTIRFERVLPGPIERIWSYLTESEKLGQWLAACEMDLRVGGRVELIFDHTKLTPHDNDVPPPKYEEHGGESRLIGRITACDPPRLLSYTWPGESPEGETEVTFELTPLDDKVLLTLTHRRLADRAEFISAAGGWHTHLDILVDHLEGKTPKPFWSTHTQFEEEYETRIPVPQGSTS